MYLIKERTVGRFLRCCTFLLISYSDVHSRVDVHTYQLLSLYHIDIHLKQDVKWTWRSQHIHHLYTTQLTDIYAVQITNDINQTLGLYHHAHAGGGKYLMFHHASPIPDSIVNPQKYITLQNNKAVYFKSVFKWSIFQFCSVGFTLHVYNDQIYIVCQTFSMC